MCGKNKVDRVDLVDLVDGADKVDRSEAQPHPRPVSKGYKPQCWA
jgi:hypothetical protein